MKRSIVKRMQALPASLAHLILSFVFMGIISFSQLGLSYLAYADTSLSLSDNIHRVQLVSQVIDEPISVGKLSSRDIEILLKKPSLKRTEAQITAWHYHGESCALDIYFNDDAEKPDYIEYRALSLNSDVEEQFQSTEQDALNQYCINDVLQAQGVDTPASYARQPLPSFESPYRTQIL
jgi:hypothetical protein